MKSSRAFLTAVCAILVLSACRNDLGSADVSVPTVLEDWQGVNRIARSGPIYFSGQPDESVFRRLAEEEGVRVVVNLCTTAEMEHLPFDEPGLVEELDMEYVNIPFQSPHITREIVDRFTEVLAGTSGPVLIHCVASVRVGGLWMAYLSLARDIDVETALEAGKAAGLNSAAIIDAVMSLIENR
ncbi:hypothetical protein ACFL3H_01840 [Gemmatimonadota bacterium]